MSGADSVILHVPGKRADVEAAVARLQRMSITIGIQGRSALVQHTVRTQPRKRRDPRGRFRKKTSAKVSRMRMVDIATVHEFGSPKANIPERSFLRRTLNDHGKIRALMMPIARAAVAGRDITTESHRAALRLEMAVKKTLTDLRDPPLAASTKRKRFYETGDRDPNPLVDTGQLRASITGVVNER